jgi:hypothetical protein
MFGQATATIGSSSSCGTLRIWKMPAWAASTRKWVFSPTLAVTVRVSTTLKMPSPTASPPVCICRLTWACSRSRKQWGAFGTSSERSLT